MGLVIAGQKSSSSWSLDTASPNGQGSQRLPFISAQQLRLFGDWLQAIPGTATRLQDRLQRICLPVNTKSGGIHIMADLFVDWGQRRRGPVNKVGKSGCRSGLGGLEKHYCRLGTLRSAGQPIMAKQFHRYLRKGAASTGRSTTLALTCLGLAQSAKDITWWPLQLSRFSCLIQREIQSNMRRHRASEDDVRISKPSPYVLSLELS